MAYTTLLGVLLNTTALLGLFTQFTTAVASQASRLNISASTAVNGVTVLQCWQLNTPFTITPGLTSSIFLGNLANATYSLFPPKADLGLHHAPAVQWVIALSGLAHVTLPNRTTTAGPESEAWLVGGRHGVFFAADTSDVSRYGHHTYFPGDADTLFLLIPTEGAKVPEHTVLHEGGCRWEDVLGSSFGLRTEIGGHDEL